MLRYAVLLGLLLGGLAAPAAADPQIAGRRVALVIGNGAYRRVDRLPNPANDARLIARTLQSLGFTLVGDGPLLDLDRAGLAQAVQDFGHALSGAEVGLFYYSGHGLQVQGVNWLVPVDANPARPQDLDFQMVDADLVLRQMDGAGTRLNLVLLDACRNNPFAARGLRALQSGLAEMRAPEGTLISYATQPGNVAADGAGANSPYTEALAAGMTQPGLDIFHLFNQVGLRVKRASGGTQQPWVSTSPIDGDFAFAPAAPPSQVAPPSQTAGLVRPPEPVAPADPPSAPPSAPWDRVLSLARPPCSFVDLHRQDDRIELRGLAVAGPAWDNFMKQVQASRAIRLSPAAIELLPPFACAPLEALGETVRATRAAEGTGLLVLTQTDIAVGGKLTLTLRRAAGQAIRLDLFQPGGRVQHLTAQQAAADGDARLVLPQSGTAGARVITALVTSVALDLGRRPETEPAGPYLAALRQALPPAARADIAQYQLRPAPTPVGIAPRPAAPARSPRCSGILERAQLGDTLSEADRAFLLAECR